MYLKCLSINGFKSFADKTDLEFKRGMTSIVGPNGCGKSNVADAIRWVLGEQSAKALRGSKMEDCIFSGTDARKPLGMAEVSVTFADCEGWLETDYHEVTISRRVYRSGEGQYFINKTPCRLKDIQRLFLGTGVGTSSYSFMQQGRIDQVLSSRPEDRRTIFEEASGITKFKADKKEALRKLEQTEANLLRLSDVIREVRRQIGSLQRQASKAQRYRVFYDELRTLDVYVSRERINTLTAELQELATKTGSLTASFDNASAELEVMTTDSAVKRDHFAETEQSLATELERANDIRNALSKGEEQVRLNDQRIRDFQELSRKTTEEITGLSTQLDEATRQRTTLDRDVREATELHDRFAAILNEATTVLKDHTASIDLRRAELHAAESALLELEGGLTRLRNHLVDLDARQRATLIQRERLAAEKSQLTRTLQSMQEREQSMQGELQDRKKGFESNRGTLAEREGHRQKLVAELDTLRTELSAIQAECAAKDTARNYLESAQASADAIAAGARHLLDTKSPAIRGTLASFLEVDAAERTAIETVLRPVADALVVNSEPEARAILHQLQEDNRGAARLLPLTTPSEQDRPVCPITGGRYLADSIRCPDFLASTLRAALGRVILVADAGAVPAPLPAGFSVVTRDGLFFSEQGWVEIWAADSAQASPLTTKLKLDDVTRERAALQTRMDAARSRLSACQVDLATVEASILSSRSAVDESRQKLSQQEGQLQVVSREAKEARERVETVTWELDELMKSDQDGITERRELQENIARTEAQQQSLSAQVRDFKDQLRRIEDKSSGLQTQVADHRVRYAHSEQKLANIRFQIETQDTRIRELHASVAKRRADVESHANACQNLEAEMAEVRGRMADDQHRLATINAGLTALKQKRDQQRQELQAIENSMSDCRRRRDDIRDQKAKLDIRTTELRFRHQTLVDRMASSYGLNLADVLKQEAPVAAEGEEAMTLEGMETRIEELRTKIEAMGPVNLGAIEEHLELENREKFLTTQEQDLVQAKQQLMEMIRKINGTTSEMFRKTFDEVNVHFQHMFETLFGGGTAKLVLTDDEDVLECGIEIIARPPGKRLQNISLMSGGERTLTAVALLFAIYLIKPSPFCMLDELDAPLDESNIGRFVNLLREFLKQSQFVVITHNRKTIAAADILYGVTMPEKGVSTIVSMRFQDRPSAPQEPLAPPAPQPPPTEPVAVS